MSDTGGPQGGGLGGRAWVWVQDVYNALAWTLEAIGPHGANTPADDMAEALQYARPAELTAPEGATAEERAAIDGALATLITQLETQVDRNDTTAAEVEVARIAGLVTAVRNRLTFEAEARAQRKVNLGSRLDALKPQAGALKEEDDAIANGVLTQRAALAQALTDSALNAVDVAVTELERQSGLIAAAIVERATARRLRYEALKGRIDTAAIPPGATTEDIAAINLRKTEILAPLSATASDEALAEGDLQADDLDTRIERLRALIEERRLKAEALAKRDIDLRNRLGGLKPVPGATIAEDKALADRAAEIIAALPSPPTDEALDEGERQADDLDTRVEAVRVAVEERRLKAEALAKRDAALRKRVGDVKAPPGATKDEEKALSDRADEILAAIPPELTDKALDDAFIAAADLEDRALKVGQAVAARGQRATELIKDLGTIKATPIKGANQAETDALTKHVDDAVAKIVAPFPPDVVKAGEEALVRANEIATNATAASNLRDQTRAALVQRLAKVPTPQGQPTDTRALAKRRADALAEIAAANDDVALAAATKTVEGIETDFPVLAALYVGQARGRASLERARAAHKAATEKIEQGFNAYLTQTIAAAGVAIDTAKTDGDVAVQENVLTTALALMAQGIAFGKTLEDWRVKTDFYLLIGVSDIDRPDVTKTRDDQAKAAQDAAALGDFVAAAKALADFDTKPKVAATGVADAAAWQKRLTDFHAAYDPGIALLYDVKHDTGGNLARLFKPALDAIQTATAKASKDKDYVTAGNLLTAAGAGLDKPIECAQLIKKFTQLQLKQKPVGDANGDKFKAAMLDLATPDAAAALIKLKDIDTAKGETGEAMRLWTSMNGQLGTVFKDTAAPYKPYVSAHLDQAKIEYDTNNKPADAMPHLATAQANLDKAKTWSEPFRSAVARAATLDGGNAFNLMATANARMGANNPDASIAAIAVANAAMDQIVAYNALLAQANALLAGLTPGLPPYPLVNTAITAATALFGTDKKVSEAVAALRALMADPAVDAMAADLSLWLQRSKALRAKTDRTIATFALNEATVALNASFALATALGDVAHKPVEGLAKLDDHEVVLADATPCAALYRRAMAVKKALERAAIAFPNPGDQAKIYAGTSKVDIDNGFAAAVADIKTAKFAVAKGKLEALLKTCETAVTNTAKLHEAADGDDSNAGHSLARHGPDLTDEQLKKRLLTGMAPDGVISYCPASTKFETIEAWLAARERAIEKANTGPKPVDVTTTSIPIAGATLRVQVEVDHGGPIDKAFDGVKEALGVTDTGDIKALGNFETFEEMDGITTSFALFIFEIASPEGAGTKPRPKDIAEYKVRYAAANGGTVPTHVTGHWVMMQNFPKAKGWNQEKQDYD